MSNSSAGVTALRAMLIGSTAVFFAALLMWQSVHWNLVRACVVLDTPYFDVCDEKPDSPGKRVSMLRTRIGDSPGDSSAYVALASVAYNSGAMLPVTSRPEASLQAATLFAPRDPDLLRLRIDAYVHQKDWRSAVPLLVELAEYHTDWEAAGILANWIGKDTQVAQALLPDVTRDSQWLGRVLQSLQIAGGSYANALPLVSLGWSVGALPRRAIQPIMRSLKSEGRWMDAYSLWLQQNAVPLGPLYNPGFDQPIRPDGFDWELESGFRAGASAQRVRMADRGFVLNVQYSGRVISRPPVRQYLFLYEGQYHLDAQYMIEKLRSEQGLAWTVRCEGSGIILGRSFPLLDTRGLWKPMSFEIHVPRDCLSVAVLQLETEAAFEATAGVTGRAYFDSFELKRIESGPEKRSN